MTVIISRLAVIFLLYAVVSSGVVGETLPCQLQRWLQKTIYARHILGLLLVFTFLMMEGGWSINKVEDEKYPNDWTSGDVLSSIVFSVAAYLAFVLTTKMQLIPCFVFMGLLLLMYLINTQRNYWHVRTRLSDKVNKGLLIVCYVLFAGACGVLIYGFQDYIRYQMRERGKTFNFVKFLLGSQKCASLE